MHKFLQLREKGQRKKSIECWVKLFSWELTVKRLQETARWLWERLGRDYLSRSEHGRRNDVRFPNTRSVLSSWARDTSSWTKIARWHSSWINFAGSKNCQRPGPHSDRRIHALYLLRTYCWLISHDKRSPAFRWVQEYSGLYKTLD